jgi:hypothetical protein
MKRFALYMSHSGGCDYSIACGQKLVYLPTRITTMKEAVEHVNKDSDDLDYDEDNTCIGYYGTGRNIKSKVIEIKSEESV